MKKLLLPILLLGISQTITAQQGVFSPVFNNILPRANYTPCKVSIATMNSFIDPDKTRQELGLLQEFGLFFKQEQILFAISQAEQKNLLSYNMGNIFPVSLENGRWTTVVVTWFQNNWRYIPVIPEQMPAGTKLFTRSN